MVEQILKQGNCKGIDCETCSLNVDGICLAADTEGRLPILKLSDEARERLLQQH